MYEPTHFRESRPEELQALIREHPLGLLVSQSAAGLGADPVPFLLDPDRGPHGTLRGHVARANPLWREATRAREVLVVFQGPSAYVSPSWYPGKQAHHKVVPTYNYSIVQARGRLRAIEDKVWLHGLVTELTQHFEGGRGAPWQVSDAPADYIETMLGAIVGIEIDVIAWSGKFKLSQNRAMADREGVVAGLQAEGHAQAGAMAQAMLRTMPAQQAAEPQAGEAGERRQ